AGRFVHVSWTYRSRENRSSQVAGGIPVRIRARPYQVRYVGIYGETFGVEADRQSSRICRARRGRADDREDQEKSVLGAASGRNRKGTSRSVQYFAAGSGGRDIDRFARQRDRFQECNSYNDLEYRGAIYTEARPSGLPVFGAVREGCRRRWSNA